MESWSWWMEHRKALGVRNGSVGLCEDRHRRARPARAWALGRFKLLYRFCCLYYKSNNYLDGEVGMCLIWGKQKGDRWPVIISIILWGSGPPCRWECPSTHVGRKGCVEGWEGERRTEAERSLKPAWARGKRQEPLSAQCQLLV